MIRFINQLQFRRERNHPIPWESLREAFPTWHRVALATDSARLAPDREKHIRLSLLSTSAWRRYVGASRDAFPRRRLWTREF